ncbi:MAG: DUF86 domain-containing protein [Promethearchaeota archaeon]
MDKTRKNRYLDKISNLKKYYNLVNEWFKESDLDNLIKTDNYKQVFAIYHAAQLSIETISDLCVMIVKDLNFNPKDNYINFEILQGENIISDKLFLALKELNGLRNRIVHDYNGFIDEIAWQSISNHLFHLDEFRKVVELWLQKQ